METANAPEADIAILIPHELSEMIRLLSSLSREEMAYITRMWPEDRYFLTKAISGLSAEEREAKKMSAGWRRLFADIETDPGVAQILAVMYLPEEKRQVLLSILEERFGTTASIPEILTSLGSICKTKKDTWAGAEEAYVLSFEFPGATTTIRIVLNDVSGAQLAITNMTTLPANQTSKGHGSNAITSLLAWAMQCDIDDIRAVQVQRSSERFWMRNSFVPMHNRTNDFRHASHA